MGQHCALLWPKMQSHRGLSATRRGTAPMGSIYTKWQIQKQPHSGGILRTASIFKRCKYKH